MPLRLLLLADTHLGFDLPTHPIVARRRRGYDFLANYERALAPAVEGRVDIVVHGGDVFHRPTVPSSLVHQAFEPLKRVAARGTPVFVVPGNHERSRIPHARLATHPGLHVFDRPRSFEVRVGGVRVSLAGFPYERRGVRSTFPALVESTGPSTAPADIRLLCVHHCFEGATVGPADYTFRYNSDVIRARDIPAGLAAVLTGHVHRHQVLTTDLTGRPLNAPVFYPGSVERTAFAEMGEPKGYVVLELEPDEEGGRVVGWTFEELPARPMIERRLSAHGLRRSALEGRIRDAVRSAPNDAVLRLKLEGRIREGAREVLEAGRLRALASPEMNIEVVVVDEPRSYGGRSRAGQRAAAEHRPRDQYALELDG